ncbi:MAG: ethanolamine ammonia-lyase subunit EutC [Planctomycetes bacterium]|nr:ethanolamine ammonia-lyase subunit EutC [Planctomycetota bacterium]
MSDSLQPVGQASSLPGQSRPEACATDLSERLAALRLRTPARILAGRAGASYRTPTHLQLRQDHAAARDAVEAEVDLTHDLGEELVRRFGLFEVRTWAAGKGEYLMRPDLGRQLCDEARRTVTERCPAGADLQVVIGDGLSAAAVVAQVPGLLPLLEAQTARRGWRFGRPFFVRYCRVGVLNDVGDLLDLAVVVLLIGERPGLATAESLSAYMAYRPRTGHTDAQRNLISNIHARGIRLDEAAWRIAALAERMRQAQASGVSVKEDLSCLPLRDLPPALPSPPTDGPS